MAHMRERRDAFSVLVGKPEVKRPHVRPMCRWEIILKLAFKMLEGEAWTGLVWFRIGTGGRLWQMRY